MVLTLRKEASSDLSYSSLNQDRKAWSSKGFYVSKTDRSASTFPSLQSTSRLPAHEEDFFEAKPDLGRSVRTSPVRYAIVNSKQSRALEAADYHTGDSRFKNSKFAYAKPLGPGSYLGAQVNDLKSVKNRGSVKGASSFLSCPRKIEKVENLPDSSDALGRDEKRWTSRGFFTSRSRRKHDKPECWGSGGLYWMAQHSRVPAFDSFYNTDTGLIKTLGSAVSDSPQRYSQSFRSSQKRFVKLANFRTNDSRLLLGKAECDANLGPGTYTPPTTVDRLASPTGTSSALFNNSNFRGTSRFDAPRHYTADSKLSRTI
mmetsp:Transcript_18730/g.61153  ORF Transcript_18730/g.61153 Transcript_18730/m.61153 type:complete len:315 (+) Transcript_18730:132-1076(+)